MEGCLLQIMMNSTKKKQITSPTKITVKQSPMIAKFGPQQVIVSDTSIKNHEDYDDSNGSNTAKWQKSNKYVQEKTALDSGWKKGGKSPQGLEYNSGWKPAPRSPRYNGGLERDNSWKQGQPNIDEGGNNKNTLNISNNFNAAKNSPSQGATFQPAEDAAPVSTNQQDYGGRPPPNDNDDEQGGQLVEKQHTFPNGDVYIGTWRGKWVEGYGVYNFNKQNLQYRGQFKKSRQHGSGVLLRKPGGNQTKQEEIYDGQWMNGEKHGLGKYYYFKDVVYDGNWVRNKKQGHGSFKSPQGEYIGEWKNDKKDGKGILKLKNGHTFQGIWVMNEFLQGTLTHSNGDRYEGEFQNFNRHGYGVYYYSNKSKYRGYWHNNQKAGQGQIQYFNGDAYQGPMGNNKRQGVEGHYKWHSGEQIVAQFQIDMPVRGKIRLPAEGQSEFDLQKAK